MISKEQFEKDLETLKIKRIDNHKSKKFVTTKYKLQSKVTHPDKPGGVKEDFQELLEAYRRVIKYLEEETDEYEEDFEAEFFKRHNFMKECSSSYVVYIQEQYTNSWKKVLEKHIVFQKLDKIRIIFKTGDITLTLYPKPKKDPRPKLHIQSRDQNKNLEFILEKLSMFYREVCEMESSHRPAINYREMERSLCGECGKTFTNKRGLKQHILRIHASVKKTLNQNRTKEITVEEEELSICDNREESVQPTAIEQKENECEIKTNDSGDQVSYLLEELFVEVESRSNFQCGECGKCFRTESESEKHITTEHEVPELPETQGQEIKKLTKIVKEQESLIKKLNILRSNGHE